jgi:hypothetical protein
MTPSFSILRCHRGLPSLSGCLVDIFGGAFSKQPEKFEQSASEPARKFVEQAFEGILPEQLVDYRPL